MSQSRERSPVETNASAAFGRPKPLLAVVLALGVLGVLSAPGGESIIIAKSATSPLDWSSTVGWDGTSAYLFGGTSNQYFSQDIVRYNPATDTFTAMPTSLSNGFHFASVIWDGTSFYLFGGFNTAIPLWEPSNMIWRYTPSTGSYTQMSATLPVAATYTSAVWDGVNAYIFGGSGNGGGVNTIARYNPATNTVTTMSATLPTDSYLASAVWDGVNAYIFGGGSSPYGIVRYNPATDTVTTMSATLPVATSSASAVWDGVNAYIFTQAGAILAYNPASNTVLTMPDELPPNDALAVWAGASAYLFHGNDVLQYVPAVPSPCTPPGIGLPPDCDAVVLCPSGIGLQLQGSPTCIGSLPPTGVKSCAVYNSIYAPSPFPGQDFGVVIEADPPGPAGDVAVCAGAITSPCVGVAVDNIPVCASACLGSPGPGWTVGADPACIGLPWVEVGAASPCPPSAAVNVRVYWGTTPGFPPGSTLDVCL